MKASCLIRRYANYIPMRDFLDKQNYIRSIRFCNKPLGVGTGLAHFHFHFCVVEIKLQVITSQLSVLTSTNLYLNTVVELNHMPSEKKIYNTKYRFSCYGARIK